MMRRALQVVGIAGVLAGSAVSPAHAQTNPKFEYQEPEQEVKEVMWKALAQAGLVLTTGNSETTTFSGSTKVSRTDADNRFTGEAGVTFVRTSLLLAIDENANGVIDPGEFDELSQTTSQAWQVKLRYDRFFAEKNSVFASALASGDEPAGREFVGGGQVGYMRQIIKDDRQELVGEAGYDYSYQDLSSGDADSIHSLRVFAGYTVTLRDKTNLEASLEALFNLNEYTTVAGEAGYFEDTRLNGQLGLTTALWEMVDFKFSFKARYDHVPAPLPPFDIGYADGFVPLADKLDTITEASLIVNFL